MDRPPRSESSNDPFTSRLKELVAAVRAAGRTQRWLAKQSGVPESTLSNWMNGVTPKSEDGLHALLKAIRRAGVPFNEIEMLRLLQISRARRSNWVNTAPAIDDSMGMPETEPPTTTSRVPGMFRLPPDTAHFTGREDILDELRGLFEQNRNQPTAVMISAIAGKAGVGKTALAIRLARLVQPRFPDGVLYVNLRGVDARPVDPAIVLANVLLAVGAAGPPLPDDLDARAGLYREWLARHRILVVLDNAANEAQVRPLLPDSSSCAAIITSRVRFGGLDSARVRTLDVLEPHQAVELLASVIDKRLDDPSDLALAREIVDRCGHLPLAVRIVGAKLKSRPYWDLRTVHDRLQSESRRLDELGDTEVRASFALSYEERPDQEKRLFRLLGLVAGPTFAPWVAAALLDVSTVEAEELVARLVDSTLLEPDGEDVNGRMRYRFHDLLRVFVWELLHAHASGSSDNDLEAALGRVLVGYLRLAELADALVEPDGLRYTDDELQPDALPAVGVYADVIDPSDPIGWFAAERSCLVTAVEQAHEAGFHQITWRLAGALTGFFSRRAHWQNWERTNALALDAAKRAGSRIGQADAMLSRGRLLIEQGRFGEAVAPIEESVSGFRGRERRGESHGLLKLANAYAEQGHWQDAIANLDECLPILRELGDRHTEAEALQSRAILHRYQGRWQDALQSIADSQAIYHELGDRLGEARALQRFGDVHRDRSDFDTAAECFERCQELCREQRDHLGQARALRGLGICYRDKGLHEEAKACFGQALEIIRRLRTLDRHGEARVLVSLSFLLIKEDELLSARLLVENCLVVYREFDDRHGVADVLHCLGNIDMREGHPDRALAGFQESHQTFRGIGDRLWQARTAESIGLVQAAIGNRSAARLAWEEALEVFRDLDVPEAQRVEEQLRSLGC
jgi:tetratricopeptide (TPR) repeat protein/transcriptional regulator with XRE-family HTH domain